MRYKDRIRKILILMLAAVMMLSGISSVYATTDTGETYDAGNQQPQTVLDDDAYDEVSRSPATSSVTAASDIDTDTVDDSDEVVHAADIDEYIDATSPADDPDPIFGTGRIKVRGILDNLEGASEGVSYDGYTLLSYDTAKGARAAYDILVDKYGEENVIVDLPLLQAEMVGAPVGWGTEFMNMDDEMKRQLSKPASGSGTVTVAVIDSGIYSSHEIFKGKTITSSSRDFIDSELGIEDEEGHGTTVAGIISESTPDNVELMILKTYVDGSNISIETVNQAVRYAADNGADVINLSMASSLKSSSAEYTRMLSNSISSMEEQLQYAEDKGVIICASSGNGGGDIDELNAYPAKSTHTIAVGSIDRNGTRSYFSNYGSSLDFCAPGHNVAVAATTGDSTYYALEDPTHCYGTSLAAPYIAACCAFVKMDNPDADILSAKETLKEISVDYGNEGWDKYFGWGMPKFADFVQQDKNGSADATKPADETKKKADADTKKKAAEARAKKVKTITVNVKTVTAAAINKAVKKAGGNKKYITKVILGKKVRKISKGAFKKYTKVRTVELRTKKLKKTAVKKALTGSRITTIKVNLGSKKLNKKYVKKYKKIFIKKISGRTVKVK